MNITINPVASFWTGKRVLLTGHTGFKGSWLSLWLQSLGAELHGLALAPATTPSLFVQARVGQGMMSTLGDIRDFETVRTCVTAFRPEIIFHMAAQPLVRLSYKEPVATYATNVMGTVHVLEAARESGTVRSIVNVTTDKCYENKEWLWGYRENEPLGGHDPYSSSKGCSELVTSAYRQSFFRDSGIALASARAGNVIGGGDWAEDRLVPDVLRAFERNRPVVIRSPEATRPWQHVLEPLSGYLQLAEKLYSEGQAWAEPWNFGPVGHDARPVQWIVEHMANAWGNGAAWRRDDSSRPHEANHLKLDISKAENRLQWTPRWNLEEALDRILSWHKTYIGNSHAAQDVTLAQIKSYADESGSARRDGSGLS
jgi:CDP-glucose 4,6-dehydratase